MVEKFNEKCIGRMKKNLLGDETVNNLYIHIVLLLFYALYVNLTSFLHFNACCDET